MLDRCLAQEGPSIQSGNLTAGEWRTRNVCCPLAILVSTDTRAATFGHCFLLLHGNLHLNRMRGATRRCRCNSNRVSLGGGRR